jgi:hypothetical protein
LTITSTSEPIKLDPSTGILTISSSDHLHVGNYEFDLQVDLLLDSGTTTESYIYSISVTIGLEEEELSIDEVEVEIEENQGLI